MNEAQAQQLVTALRDIANILQGILNAVNSISSKTR
jgi:hypothetical protein